MRLVSADDWRCRRMQASLREVRRKRFVPAREPTLRLLLLSHSPIRTDFCEPVGQLDVIVRPPSPSFPIGQRSKLLPGRLTCVLPPIEDLNPQSFSLIHHETTRTFYRPPRGHVPFALCVVPHSDPHHLFVASWSHLFFLPLHFIGL